jgi:hypothetical protein
MSDLIKVEGQACLDYIDKPIGFGSHDYVLFGNMPFNDQSSAGVYGLFAINTPRVSGDDNRHSMWYGGTPISTTLQRWTHDTNKRKIGLVLDYSPDGGLEVALLGNENIAFSSTNGNMDFYATYLSLVGEYAYDTPATPLGEYTLETPREGGYPRYPTDTAQGGSCKVCVNAQNPFSQRGLAFDDAMDYTPTSDGFATLSPFGLIWEYAGLLTSGSRYQLTDDKNNTMVFGKIQDLHGNSYYYYKDCMENPLNFIAGNLYNALGTLNFEGEQVLPQRIPFGMDFNMIKFPANSVELTRTNLTALPFNLILTNSPAYAKNYLDNGTLPPDAFLYPLDLDNLPRYDDPVPTGDEPDDYPDDNTPDDDERDFDPTPNEIVSYTVNQLTNYNWYWLTVAQWYEFINWFWNDIGNYSDFDDIIAKVKGLYNDVASAVIMCRYYPVNYKWITQKRIEDAPTGNIKLGMIEKAGAVQMIDQEYSLRTEDIGHIHIGQKYKSFMDMSPYSQLSLYLPWHGFIDLDMNLFNGHDVYVKALYDYLSGTIQYYIFYDNQVLVNTILCKMAMDIPITLQTKNDRDSAIFNNVSSTIGGLVGAGAGILSGNPLGMTLGVTQGVSAFNSANASAPMRLMGNVGESGAYIGCQNCFVVVRRPTIQASDGKKNNTDVDTSIDRLTTWKKNVGMLCGYGYTLSSLSGKGFTVCHSPRINFTNTAPLQSEVDEIYDYLEKGVIL